MLPKLELDPQSDAPLYRQLYDHIKLAIHSGRMVRGERLPATRDLAGSLGLNRTTVSAAYELLEAEGLIKGHVGRGSFVEWTSRVDWESIIPAEESAPPAAPALISFSASRPSEMQFPLEEFRVTCREVIDSSEAAQILQLGPAGGYGPLRRYLLAEARRRGEAGPDDDILITSGCQQAFDLIQRVPRSRTANRSCSKIPFIPAFATPSCAAAPASSEHPSAPTESKSTRSAAFLKRSVRVSSC